MAAVDVVGRLPGLVGPVQQAAIFGVPEEELGQPAAPPTDGDVEGRVSFLRHRGRVLTVTLTTADHGGMRRETHLVHRRHLRTFVQKHLHDLHVPHLGGFDQRTFSILKKTRPPSGEAAQVRLLR